MPKIKVNDINMYYEIHGDGFPLFMIQGLGGGSEIWAPATVDLLSKHFKVILFDNRGSGRTDKPEIAYSIDMFAADTAGLMDALNIEKGHVLGISMGGMVAQGLALNFPERVETLILCSTNCGFSKSVLPSPEILKIMMVDRGELTAEELLRSQIPFGWTNEFVKSNPEFIEDEIQRIILNPTPEFSRDRQLLAASKYNTYRKLKKIAIPTLILQGKEDVLTPPENAEILAQNIPRSKLIMLDDSSHRLFQPYTEKVVNYIVDFVNTSISKPIETII
jgi:pimeloyl-ACP methyl ester carboxylesterase